MTEVEAVGRIVNILVVQHATPASTSMAH